jgi:hypothetical protein
MENKHEIVVGKGEGKIQLMGTRRRWEDNITINLEEVRSEDVE